MKPIRYGLNILNNSKIDGVRIGLLDSFYEESHAHWAEGLKKYSMHSIDIYSNKPTNWKWQMIGGTYELANEIYNKVEAYDLLIVTDMIDLPCFIGYLKDKKLPPICIYFHENQITYPWSPKDQDVKKNRDHHYGFMNLRSALVADQVVFNSSYHKASFLNSLPMFYKQFPSFRIGDDLEKLKTKSSVLPIGLPSEVFNDYQTEGLEMPIFLWNHRWEYDKSPDDFFKTLYTLDQREINFELIVLGKSRKDKPPIFAEAKEKLKHRIIHWGYAESKNEYYNLLAQANILLVTGIQDFFGISVVEAIKNGCYPILPNRLAYPEHIPVSQKESHLYNDECMPLVMEVIENRNYLDKETKKNNVRYMDKYDWNVLIGQYDLLFEKMSI